MILVIGEALVDVVTSPQGTTVRPGGSPTNVAVGLGRLGFDVQLVTALGPDEYGELVRAHLEASNVAVHASPLAQTSVACASLDGSGAASYDFALRWELTGVERVIPKPSWLHVGSIAVTLAPGSEQLAALVNAHAGAAVVSYDPNCRPQLMGDPQAVLPVIERQVAASELVKLSNEDAEWLFPAKSLDEVASRWLSLGVRAVVVTKGAEGASAWTADNSVSVAAESAGLPIRDTVGAGDSFMAALIARLSVVQSESRYTEEALGGALEFASRVARMTCERVGADPPWSAELIDSHTAHG